MDLLGKLAAQAGLRRVEPNGSVPLELWTVVEGRLWARQDPTRQLRALLRSDEVLLAVEQPVPRSSTTPVTTPSPQKEAAEQQYQWVQLVHRVPGSVSTRQHLVGIPALLRVPSSVPTAGTFDHHKKIHEHNEADCSRDNSSLHDVLWSHLSAKFEHGLPRGQLSTPMPQEACTLRLMPGSCVLRPPPTGKSEHQNTAWNSIGAAIVACTDNWCGGVYW